MNKLAIIMLVACLSITACGRQKLTQIPQPQQAVIDSAYVKSLEKNVEIYERDRKRDRCVIYVMLASLLATAYGGYRVWNHMKKESSYRIALVSYCNSLMIWARNTVSNTSPHPEKISEQYFATSKVIVEALQNVDIEERRINLNSMLKDIRFFSEKDELMTGESRTRIQEFIEGSRITLKPSWYMKSFTFLKDGLRWAAQRKMHKRSMYFSSHS